MPHQGYRKNVDYVYRLSRRLAFLDLYVKETEHDIQGTGAHLYPTLHLQRQLKRQERALAKVRRDWEKAVYHLRRKGRASRQLLTLAMEETAASEACRGCKRPMHINVDGVVTVYPPGRRHSVTFSGLPQQACGHCKVERAPHPIWDVVLAAVFPSLPHTDYDLRDSFRCQTCGGVGEYESGEALLTTTCACTHGYVFDGRPLRKSEA